MAIDRLMNVSAAIPAGLVDGSPIQGDVVVGEYHVEFRPARPVGFFQASKLLQVGDLTIVLDPDCSLYSLDLYSNPAGWTEMSLLPGSFRQGRVRFDCSAAHDQDFLSYDGDPSLEVNRVAGWLRIVLCTETAKIWVDCADERFAVGISSAGHLVDLWLRRTNLDESCSTINFDGNLIADGADSIPPSQPSHEHHVGGTTNIYVQRAHAPGVLARRL